MKAVTRSPTVMMFVVAEGEPLQMPHASTAQTLPRVGLWHAGYCVARTDEQSLICYKAEQVRGFGRCEVGEAGPQVS